MQRDQIWHANGEGKTYTAWIDSHAQPCRGFRCRKYALSYSVPSALLIYYGNARQPFDYK